MLLLYYVLTLSDVVCFIQGLYRFRTLLWYPIRVPTLLLKGMDEAHLEDIRLHALLPERKENLIRCDRNKFYYSAAAHYPCASLLKPARGPPRPWSNIIRQLKGLGVFQARPVASRILGRVSARRQTTRLGE